MRLIDVQMFLLEEFEGEASSIPSYAILSHTWGDQEVSYQQFIRPNSTLLLSEGYKKITACCLEARQRNLQYVWIDTCCIDKTSSSEVSEAINSMYRWYTDAAMCFVYLSDVDGWHPSVDDVNDLQWQIEQSRYFTRSWTLQELIAPKNVVFYDTTWVSIWTKHNIPQLLERITGVSQDALLHKKSLSDFSIACRMSWASAREATRSEDIAYSLLGIFNINMPLLYGEGRKAFQRLQEEIIKDSDDQSIFAWDQPLEAQGLYMNASVLAQHPREFIDSQYMKPIETLSVPYSLTNRGIAIELPLAKGGVALLACHNANGDYGPLKRIAIPLLHQDGRKDVYARDLKRRLKIVTSSTEVTSAKSSSIFLVRAANAWADQLWLAPSKCITPAGSL